MEKVLSRNGIRERISKNEQNYQGEAVYNHSGQLTSNAEETLDVMAQTHFKDCAHDLRAPHDTIVTPSDNLTCKIYNPDWLQQTVDSFDPLKAAGPDTIRRIIVQKVLQHIKANTRSIMIRNHELQPIPIPLRQLCRKLHTILSVGLPKRGMCWVCSSIKREHSTIYLSKQPLTALEPPKLINPPQTGSSTWLPTAILHYCY
jgi:hypothetical protein